MRMKALNLIVAGLLLVGLTGCYLPNKFELTMQVAEDGRYATAYSGTLTQLQFLQRLGAGEIQGSAVDEYVEIYESDMRRDSGFNEVTYLGNAEYQVDYERQGSLARERQFSFPSRNAVILGLRRWTPETAQEYIARFQHMGHPALPAMSESGLLREEHIMEIFGERLPLRIREDLVANGFWVQGQIRIWTAARVGYHNAQQVMEGNPSLYIWDIDSLHDEAPHMILAWTPPEE